MSQKNKIKGTLGVDVLQVVGKNVTINAQIVKVRARDGAGNVSEASGTVVINDGAAGYAKGAVYVKTDAGAGVDGTYRNIGTTSACQFVLAASIGDITAVTAGDGLVGGGSTGAVTLATGLQITNKSGAILNPGELVFTQMVGGVLSARKVDAVGTGGPPYAIYVVKTAIAIDAVGFIYGNALVTGLDTSLYAVGDYLGLSPTVAGGWINIGAGFEFDSDATEDVVGLVLTSNAVTGQVLFFPGMTFTLAQPTEEAQVRQQAINVSGGAYTPGTLVAPAAGGNADYRRMTFVKADANAGIPATHVVLSTINNNDSGDVWRATMVGSLNTNAGNVGDLVYLDTTAGGWTLTPPSGANELVQAVGVITVKDAAVGKIYFFPGITKVTKIGTNELQSGSVTLAKLASGVTPSHVIKLAATTAAYGGGGTSNAFVATGLLATDIVSAVIRTSTNSVSIVKAVPTADTLTVTFSADPGAGTTVDYIAARAAV